MMRTACLLALITLASSMAPAATAPAEKAAPAAKVPDLARGPVDPYDVGDEKDRFLDAAGNDNELTAEEFTANAAKKRPFARKFDSWRELVAFDKNRNGKIDWMEADAYRDSLQKRAVAAFDTNKDGKLSGAERDALNRTLAAGRLPTGVAARPDIIVQPGANRGTDNRDSRRRDTNRRGPQWSAEDIKKYDRNNDGQLDRREARDAMRQRILDQYDTNKDGKLDDKEREAMRKAWQERMQQARQQWMTRRYDKDGDGKLSEQEKATMEAEQQQRAKLREQAQQWSRGVRDALTKTYDANNDGKIDGDERRTMWRQMRTMMREVTKAADTDKDGRLSTKEMADYRDQMVKKYDADGDGKLSATEMQKMIRDRIADLPKETNRGN